MILADGLRGRRSGIVVPGGADATEGNRVISSCPTGSDSADQIYGPAVRLCASFSCISYPKRFARPFKFLRNHCQHDEIWMQPAHEVRSSLKFSYACKWHDRIGGAVWVQAVRSLAAKTSAPILWRSLNCLTAYRFAASSPARSL